MTITITIPKPTTIVRRGWKFGLLALVALALVFTWGRHSTQQAQAGVSPGILIEKVDNAIVPLGGACFQVFNSANTIALFRVCDDNFMGAPDKSPFCLEPANQCADVISPGPGTIFVPVPPGVYHVVEIIAPAGYNLDPSKQVCTVNGVSAGCSGLPVEFVDIGKSQININKIAQYVPPKSCYNVFSALNQPPALFQVCDNDWQGPPALNAVCVPDGVCNDEDSAVGSVRVTVAAADYHVVESKPPPNHTADLTKHDCNAVVSVKCDVTVIDAPVVRPWYPWDLENADTSQTGADGIVDISDVVAVVLHYFCQKPLTAATPTPAPQPGC